VSVMFWAASLDALAAAMTRQNEEIRMRLHYAVPAASARMGV